MSEDTLLRKAIDLSIKETVKKCIEILHETAEDIDNGDIFRDQELLNKFEERWSAGLYYGAEQLKNKFGIE